MKANERVAQWVFSILLYFYPSDFRRAYARELTLLFVDMYREAKAQGIAASFHLWWRVLLDTAANATNERIRTMHHSKLAIGVSVLLCVPLLFVIVSAMTGYEPPFLPLLNRYMLSPDGYTPTLLGRVVMLVMLLGVPVAFVINLMPMLRRRASSAQTPFVPTRLHILIGMVTLAIIVSIFATPVLHELRSLLAFYGANTTLWHGLYLAAMLVLPIAFLLNRLPRFGWTGGHVAIGSQTISVSLIVGAAILLIILMVGSAFALEQTACSVGVPNCD